MTDNTPKSALELAMERLRQKDKESNAPERPLTDEQKAGIAEVRQMYQAKTAEHEILHQAALRKAGERDRKIAAIREGGEHMAKGRSMQKEKKKPKKEKK